MFQTGERVMYGVHGVCDIIGTETQTQGKIYLILEPVSQPGSRYMVPTANAAAMAKVKKLLTREELETLISSESARRDVWIRDEGQRKLRYREIISSADREALMAMVHSLYRHREEQTNAGRKMHLYDENFLRDAEKLLAGETAIVLNMEPEEAKQYIRRQLKA